MALIVETGAVVAGAESYATIAQANAYHMNYNNAAWDAADSEVQEAALRKATAYIDGRYRFRGERASSLQVLAWPRVAVAVGGYELPYSAIPAKLVAATCELALRALTGELVADVTTQHVESVRVGPISRTMSAPGNGGQVRYAAVDALLRDFTRGGNASVPVVRA